MRRHLTRAASVTCLSLLMACATSGVELSEKAGDFTYVFISVSPETTEAGAVLVDKHGNRSGWNVPRTIKPIPGCDYSSNTGEGIPDREPGDSLELPESAAVERQTAEHDVPRYHVFRLTKPVDASAGPGVLAEGTCVLWVEAKQHGRVRVASQAKRGSGDDCGRANVQKVVDPGMRYRWRIEWKPAGDSCSVRIVALGEQPIRSGN